MEQIVFDKAYLLEARAKILEFIDSINSMFDSYFQALKDERLATGFKFPLFWDDIDFGSFLRTNGILDQYKDSLIKEGQKLLEEIDTKIEAFEELHSIQL